MLVQLTINRDEDDALVYTALINTLASAPSPDQPLITVQSNCPGIKMWIDGVMLPVIMGKGLTIRLKEVEMD